MSDIFDALSKGAPAPFLPPFLDPYDVYTRKDKVYSDLEQHHSMLDSASTPDPIKINILYDALKRLENETIAQKSNTQAQISLIIDKIAKLEAENEELKKAIAELIQSRYFD